MSLVRAGSVSSRPAVLGKRTSPSSRHRSTCVDSRAESGAGKAARCISRRRQEEKSVSAHIISRVLQNSMGVAKKCPSPRATLQALDQTTAGENLQSTSTPSPDRVRALRNPCGNCRSARSLECRTQRQCHEEICPAGSRGEHVGLRLAVRRALGEVGGGAESWARRGRCSRSTSQAQRLTGSEGKKVCKGSEMVRDRPAR